EVRPDQIEAYRRLAMLLRRRLNRAQEADQVMTQLIASNERSYQAYLDRAAYLRRFNPPLAEEDLNVALRLAPNEAEVLLRAAEMAQDKNDLGKAREYLQRGMQLYPKDHRMFQVLADLELGAGKPDQAIAELRRGLETIPDQPDLLWRLADLQIQQRQPQEAENAIVRLQQINILPAVVECLRARIMALRGVWPEAARTLEQAIPDLVNVPDLAKQALLVLAQCYQELGDTERSLAASRRAVTTDPLWPPARFA